MNFLSSKQKESIKRIKQKYNFDQISKSIENLEGINPLVIGEIIIDKYQFTETLGKSGKEPVLVLKKKTF